MHCANKKHVVFITGQIVVVILISYVRIYMYMYLKIFRNTCIKTNAFVVFTHYNINVVTLSYSTELPVFYTL